MPTVCCALKCSHNFKNCKLKKFPTNATKARVWESLLRKKNFKRKAFHRICVCHFDEEQFERQNDKNGRRLRADAVPLHFPTHTVKRRSLGGDNYIEEERKTVGFIDGKDLPLKNLIRFVNSKQNLTECQYDVKLYNRSTNGITSNEEWSIVGSIDGKDMPQRNWMQFVNFKENIMESQYDGKLYNRTFDDVPSSKELFAYYGGSSQQQLEIQNIKENIGGPHSNLVAHAHDKTPMVLRERTQTETENDENENDAPAIKQELIPDLPSAVKKENEQIQTETEYDKNENDAPAIEPEIVPDVVPSAVKEKDERTQIKTEHDENENDAPPIEMEIVPDLVPFGVKEKNAAPPQEPVSTGTLPASETKQTPKDEKKYFCAYCSKTFKDMGQLRQHIRIHTGEKPYTCTHCPRKFSQQCHLDVHTRNHTGEKPFSCTHCSKKFNQKVHLVKHERIHTGEKPFSCTICSRKFNDASNLRQHLWTHRDEKPYSCSYCSKQFCRKKYLDIHTKDIHGDEATLPHVDE